MKKANANPLLSPREKQLLRRLARNKSDEEIAADIGGRTDQITLQRARLTERLQIQSQEHLSALARSLAPWDRAGVASIADGRGHSPRKSGPSSEVA